MRSKPAARSHGSSAWAISSAAALLSRVEPRHGEADVAQRALAPGAAAQRAGGAEDDAARGPVGPPAVSA